MWAVCSAWKPIPTTHNADGLRESIERANSIQKIIK